MKCNVALPFGFLSLSVNQPEILEHARMCSVNVHMNISKFQTAIFEKLEICDQIPTVTHDEAAGFYYTLAMRS